MKRYISHCELETAQIAQALARAIRDYVTPNQPILIGLDGNLGMGKSVFARAFIRELVGDADLSVPSPTFTLVQYYDSPIGPVYHYDLYRLEHAEEIYEIGWEDSLSDGISLIEWPERLMGMKPAGMLDILMSEPDNEGSVRLISIDGDFPFVRQCDAKQYETR